MNWSAVAVGAIFTWLGMDLAISFIEAPLKFRAPGITIPLGLGIGRLVFRALNTVEAILAVVIVISVKLGGASCTAGVAIGVAILALVLQVGAVRPFLKKRSDAVLADTDGTGATGKRSRAHFGYTGLEIVKVIALLTGGVALLGGITGS